MSSDPNKLRTLLDQQMWRPSYIGLLVNPFYFARKGLMDGLSKCAGEITGTTLDLGCGDKPYRDLYSSTDYFGMEIYPAATGEKRHADILYDGARFPLADGALDSVVANQVLEHVFHPDILLGEIHRALRQGGTLLVSAPFAWDEHEQPSDFARYSSFGLRALLERHGFIVRKQYKSVNDFRAIVQLLNAYIYKSMPHGSKVLRLLTTLLLIAPVNLLGALLGPLLPQNPDFYLDNIMVAKKVRKA